jgi:hypothetical protein
VIDDITKPLSRDDRDRLAGLVNVLIQHHFGESADEPSVDAVTPSARPPSSVKGRERPSPPP